MDPRTALANAGARVRAGAWGSLQCGLAAYVAWEPSTRVLGHSRPYFAAVAAVVCLGLRAGQRLRRTAELAVGVSAGVLMGDLLVQLLGQGAWQIGVVVSAALLVAVAIGGTGLAVTQAGLQAVFVVALPRTPHSGLHRWQDALVGGATALVVAALLAQDPWREAKRLRASYVEELARLLREVGAATQERSTPRLSEALDRGRALDPVIGRWQEALTTGHDTARLSPLRHDRREREQFWVDSTRVITGLTRASRNLRVLVRRVLSAVDAGQSLPACLPTLLSELAAAVDVAGDGDAAVGPLVDLAGRLDPGALGATGLAGQVAVGQLRVAVVDLLEGLGLEHDRARNSLPELV